MLASLIVEKTGSNKSMDDWITDFQRSNDPRFRGKSKAERRMMAMAAYYHARNEEEEIEWQYSEVDGIFVGPGATYAEAVELAHALSEDEEDFVFIQQLFEEDEDGELEVIGYAVHLSQMEDIDEELDE